MTTRILPRDEYPRLVGTELETVAALLPDDSHVLVVEDGDRIVGCWAALRVVHLEGIWIHPDYRGGVAALRLWRGIKAVVRAMGRSGAVTAALSDDVEGLITRLGGALLPGRHFSVSMGDTPSCPLPSSSLRS